MNDGTGKTGQALASAGGLGLAISLWLPWYTIHIPQATLNSVVQMSQQWGALAPLVRTGAQLINQLGPFHVRAWQVFTATPAVLLTVAIIGGGLALAAFADRAGNTAQLTMIAGAVGALLVGYRLIAPPWQSSFVSPDWGIYVALASSLAMLCGGYLATRGGETAEPFPLTPRLAPYAPVPPATGWEAAVGPALSVAADPMFGAPVAAADSWSTTQSVPPPAA